MHMKARFSVVIIACLITAMAQAQDLALLRSLGGLGISPTQAIGGTKALMNIAKGNLGADEYGQLLAGAPELGQVLEMTDAAPALSSVAGGGATSAGAMAAAPATPTAVPGLDALTGNADLIQQFTDLGMDAGMLARFVPALLDAVGGAGGTGTLGLLKKGLGPL